MKTCVIGIVFQKQQNPFNKLNKINPIHIRTSYISNLNNNSYLFLKIEVEIMKKNGGFLRETW